MLESPFGYLYSCPGWRWDAQQHLAVFLCDLANLQRAQAAFHLLLVLGCQHYQGSTEAFHPVVEQVLSRVRDLETKKKCMPLEIVIEVARWLMVALVSGEEDGA